MESKSHPSSLQQEGWERNRVSLPCSPIIPQDPFLFQGTTRYNLDPVHDFDDDALWGVVEQVELLNRIPSLDLEVTDGGLNFSAGQRQLLCLARAILRQNRIIVMDEATAALDPWTDNLIQKTIRSKFSNCTIITIAYRLQSIMDNDRILVLSFGELLEYDHPHILLSNPNSHFTSMVNQLGPYGRDKMIKIARNTYDLKMSKETTQGSVWTQEPKKMEEGKPKTE